LFSLEMKKARQGELLRPKWAIKKPADEAGFSE
jgi:hypothetical protein